MAHRKRSSCCDICFMVQCCNSSQSTFFISRFLQGILHTVHRMKIQEMGYTLVLQQVSCCESTYPHADSIWNTFTYTKNKVLDVYSFQGSLSIFWGSGVGGWEWIRSWTYLAWLWIAAIYAQLVKPSGLGGEWAWQ